MTRADGAEPHYPELRALAEQDPEFREWLGEAACPEVQRCNLWPECEHELEAHERAEAEDERE